MEIKRNENTVEIIVPVTKYFMQLFVFGIPSILITLGLSFLLFKSIISFDFNFSINIIGPLIFGPILANYSLWLFIGKEKMLIEKDTILYTKTNGIFTFRKIYKKSEITKISVIEKTYKSDSFIDTKRENIREQQRSFPFWIRMGKIEIHFKNKEVTIFNGLNNSEMNEVCEILKREIEK